ncbi:1-deoxy-D-xylulose-5-phosphate reductoisomerase [Tuwongella immobilis]|uniref:1-deoxy-D-xylulose-5-phosphate reductoisomerase n=1 Tax=Tuwongella immobilis TaxID=692036 RepID=UPI001E286DCE|nr:1-deoxy-D-xylulose-5-phosphate reductoisomerase [Tuwongella immobilis]
MSGLISPTADALRPRPVVVLGSTGSIGRSTLDVLAHLPDRFPLLGIAARSSVELFLEQVQTFKPRYAVLTDRAAFERALTADLPPQTQLLFGEEGIAKMVTDADTSMVVSAIVGAAGLFGTCQALEVGKTVALANKETLVVGGERIMELADARGTTLLPVDSEHSAIFQAIGNHPMESVERVVLTGSGGPFRGRSAEQLANVTIEQALNHPTWKMGPKITVDSATLMNKALEVIEARWLFRLPSEKIAVILHPESIVHSFVEFIDGSVLAQLSPPDMRLPIQYALTWPDRVPGPTRRLNWETLANLRFEQPDRKTFPALDLGFEVAQRGGTCGAVLNGANEVAVEQFLEGLLPFDQIAQVVRDVLHSHHFMARPSLDELWAAERWARQEVVRWNRHRIRP